MEKLKKLKAVVIEPDEGVRRLAVRALESAGLETRQAGDAVSGFRAIERTRPQVIVTGRALPGEVNGPGLCRLLRYDERFRDCLLVMIGQGGEGAAKDADLQLNKPLDPDTLKTRVKEHMKHRGMI